MVRKGGNAFHTEVTESDIKQIKSKGLRLIRLTPSKWKSVGRDFLVGDADNYTGIPEEDFQTLKRVLDLCQKRRIRVVLTMLTLPGSRWRQHNGYVSDHRIYSVRFQEQAARFYLDLVTKLKGHKAIVGYDLLNEPHPYGDWADMTDEQRQNAQTDLHQLYIRCVASIRSIDKEVPIILETPGYADPKAFDGFLTLDDPNLLYSFHMYEPYELTTYRINKGRFIYPGKAPDKYLNGEEVHWNRQRLEEYMSQVEIFQQKHKIPGNQILLGEFGGDRRIKGIEKYLKDLLRYVTSKGYHACFYAVLDDWNGCNYEVGSEQRPQPGVVPKAWKLLQNWFKAT